MSTIFEVTNNDLNRLTAQTAVDRFQDMIWADARRIGVPATAINAPSRITVPDGGIDASVAFDLSNLPNGDIIINNRVGYQIKAGENFDPTNKSHLKKELFGKTNSGTAKPACRENLGAEITRLMEANGTYVLITTKHDLTNQQAHACETKLVQLLNTAGFPNASVKVWTQNQLEGILKRYPSIALEIKGPRGDFQTHKSWGINAEMRRDYFPGQPQKERIEAIREKLRDKTKAIEERVLGPAGIGKTRLVYEALNCDEFRSLVVYCDHPKHLDGGPLMTALLRDDNDYEVLLVVDECENHEKKHLWDRLQYRGSRIRLVTIHQDPKSQQDLNSVIEILPDPQITEIIASYGIDRNDADRYARLCKGYPRFAHMLGNNLVNHPEDLLNPIDENWVWDRVLAGDLDPHLGAAQQQRCVLRYIALFKKFGFGIGPVGEEGRAIARLVNKHVPTITEPIFNEIVRKLCGRNILQGNYILYLTPNILHIQLWCEWWENYGAGGGFQYDEFVKDISATSSLKMWFYEMFQFAAESGVAERVVLDLLGPEGPFENDEYLETHEGSRFFRSLADANLEATLSYLERTLLHWPQGRLQEFQQHRQEIVWALEKMAYDGKLFERAVRVLLPLARTDTSTFSNNSRGTLVGLFSLAYGNVAPTSAPPDKRFPLLKEMMFSEQPEVRGIARDACESALRVFGAHRMVGPEYRGLRRTAKGWTPSTGKEVIDAFQRVWKLVDEASDLELPDDEKAALNKIITDNARGITTINESLADMVLDTLSRVAEKDLERQRAALNALYNILRYDKKRHPTEVISKIEALIAKLEGTSFDERLKRFVGMPQWEEIHGTEEEAKNRIETEMKRLATEVLDNPKMLMDNLDWLFSKEAELAQNFGNALANLDTDYSYYEMLLTAQSKMSPAKGGSTSLVSGYLRYMFDNDQKRWHSEALRHLNADYLTDYGLEMVSRSGLTDEIVRHILKLARDGKIVEPEHLQILEAPWIRKVMSDETVIDVMHFLKERQDFWGIASALVVFYFNYVHERYRKDIPTDFAVRLLTNQIWGEPGSQKRHGWHSVDHEWCEVAKVLIDLNREYALEVSAFMLDHFGDDGTIFEGYYNWHLQEPMNNVAKMYPDEMWTQIAERLGPPITNQAYHIYNWLRGDKLPSEQQSKVGALYYFPPELLWQWIDADVENRAWYAAMFVPKELHHDPDRICFAREILVRYGSRDDVQRNLTANYSTESWMGPASSHHEGVKQTLLKFASNETDPNVLRWIKDYVKDLNCRIEQATIREEREF